MEQVVEELGPATLPGTRAYALKSRIVDQTFLIEVARPMGWDRTTPLPVIYVLDGNMGFAMTTQAAWMMQLLPDTLPPCLIVGVGYHLPDKDGPRPMQLRMRDLTPDVDEGYLATIAETPGRLPPGVGPGGADAFLRFIEEEAKPFVAARYAVDAGNQTLAGMSLGGLTTLQALFTAPQSYQRYLAASPSIWWNKRSLLEREAALAERVTDLPVRLYLCVGGEEEAINETAHMVSNVYDLEGRLRRRAWPGLDMHMHIFEGENHQTVWPGALARGLRWLFRG